MTTKITKEEIMEWWVICHIDNWGFRLPVSRLFYSYEDAQNEKYLNWDSDKYSILKIIINYDSLNK